MFTRYDSWKLIDIISEYRSNDIVSKLMNSIDMFKSTDISELLVIATDMHIFPTKLLTQTDFFTSDDPSNRCLVRVSCPSVSESVQNWCL